MSEKRFTLVFLIALLLGGSATFGVYKFVNAQKLAAAQLGRIDTAPVVVVTRGVSEGAALEKGDLTIRYFPADGVPDGSFPDPEMVVDRVTYTRLYPGEPVIESKLAPEGAQPGLEVKIAPGNRAMAIRMSDVVGVTGLIRPGSRVDVLVTMRARNGSRSQPIGKVILQNMRVLSVGTHTERGDPSKPIVSSAVVLEVTPQEAEILAVAMNEGTLSLALRSYGDPETPTTPGATADAVLAGIPILKPKPQPRPRPRPRPPVAQPEPEPEPEPTQRTVQIYRGNRLEEKEVEKDSTRTDTTRADNGRGDG